MRLFCNPRIFNFQELLCSIPPESILQNHSLNSTQPIITRKRPKAGKKKKKSGLLSIRFCPLPVYKREVHPRDTPTTPAQEPQPPGKHPSPGVYTSTKHPGTALEACWSRRPLWAQPTFWCLQALWLKVYLPLIKHIDHTNHDYVFHWHIIITILYSIKNKNLIKPQNFTEPHGTV